MGTHPIFESDFDCLTESAKMKTIHHSQEVSVDEGVTISVKSRVVTVTGPRGTLTKNFRHLKVDIKQTTPDTLLVEKWFPNHFSTNSVSGVVCLISTFKCRKFLVRVPRGPVTVTTRDLTEIVTPSSTETSCE